MSQQEQPESQDELIPPGLIRGAAFAKIGWALVRSRGRLLAPTMAITAFAIAIVDIALSTWVFGSVSQAAAKRFDPATVLATWATHPLSTSEIAISRAVIAVVATGLLLPLIATAAAGAVVADAERGAIDDARGYFKRGMSATPPSLVATVMGAVVAGTPIVATLLVTTRLNSEQAQAAALLMLGAPTLVWLLLASIRLSLTPQAVAMEKAGPVVALMRSWNVTRGRALRVAAVTVVTGLVAALVSALVAAPVTTLGTFASAGQSTPGTGKLLAEHFLATAVSSFVASTMAAVVAALLFIDLRRPVAPMTPPIAD